MNHNLIERAKKKATRSNCRYRISALGVNYRGEVICSSFNKPRFERKYGGLHAEQLVMLKAGPSLKNIILCRTNKFGKLLKIEPCQKCSKMAKKLGVKIITIME